MTQSIRLRRQRHQQHQASIAELRPLTFATDSSDIDCAVVHVFDDEAGNIALSFVTARGSIVVRLPPGLAADMANGVTKLIWQRHVPRYDGDPVG
jgi:hypothetical protein